MTESPKPKRLATADLMRTIACLLVVWFHLGGGAGSAPGMELLGSTISLGYLGVHMFFVLSGFIVPYAMHRADYTFPRDYPFFLARRLVRLDPPYLVASFVSAIVAWLATLSPAYRGPPADITWQRSLAHVGYLNGILGMRFYDAPCWTLGIEFQFYLILALIFPALVSRSRVLRIGVHLFVLALTYAAVHTGIVSRPDDDTSCWILSWAPFFLLGIASFQRFAGISGNTEYWSVVVSSMLVGFLTGRVSGVWAGGITAILLAFASFPDHPVVAAAAAMSYSLYLTHSPIGERVVRLGLRMGSGPGVVAASLVTAVVASLASAYLLYRYTEVPALRWASRIRLSGHSTHASRPSTPSLK